MRAPQISPPDVLGFQHVLANALNGHENAGDLLDLIDRFVASYRELDAWKLKHCRAKSFAPCEPCFHADAPAVVISTTPVRVSIRRWIVPIMRAGFPMSGEVRWVDPSRLTKVGSKSKVEAWAKAMAMCGQEPDQWCAAAMISRIA